VRLVAVRLPHHIAADHLQAGHLQPFAREVVGEDVDALGAVDLDAVGHAIGDPDRRTIQRRAHRHVTRRRRQRWRWCGLRRGPLLREGKQEQRHQEQ